MYCKIKKPELVAPAGNLNKLTTALSFGADAVYFGLPDFSLRARANDFDEASLLEGANFAHSIEKKVYATLNIFAKNRHFEKIEEHIDFLKRINIDGIFISDPGIASVVKKRFPDIKIVLSTQANCTNYESAIFWLRNGFSRVVLARELSLAEIVEIKSRVPDLEVECFVHGALCMSYSGRCLLSSYYSGRESNLGDCSQPCRWKFYISSRCYNEDELGGSEIELVEDQDGSYIFNSKDLCLIKKVPQMIMAGIDAFKIEGRSKSVYYLANVVGMYRQVIDDFCNDSNRDDSYWDDVFLKFEDDLKNKIFNRGYTEGFAFGSSFAKENNGCSHEKAEWEFCGQFFRSVKSGGYFKNYFFVHNTVRLGDLIEIIEPPYNLTSFSVNKIFDHSDNEVTEVHGGAGDTAYFLSEKSIMEYSIMRRKIV